MKLLNTFQRHFPLWQLTCHSIGIHHLNKDSKQITNIDNKLIGKKSKGTKRSVEVPATELQVSLIKVISGSQKINFQKALNLLLRVKIYRSLDLFN